VLPNEPVHRGLERAAYARGGKAMSGARPCAQHGLAPDCLQPSLVPRSGFRQQVKPHVRGLTKHLFALLNVSGN
jgi:hypothetical protein